MHNIVHIRSNGIGCIWKIRIYAVQAVIKETDMGHILAKGLPRPVAIVCRPIERSMKAITIIFLTSINRQYESVLMYTREKIMLSVLLVALELPPLHFPVVSSLDKHYSSLTTQTEGGDSGGNVLYAPVIK